MEDEGLEDIEGTRRLYPSLGRVADCWKWFLFMAPHESPRCMSGSVGRRRPTTLFGIGCFETGGWSNLVWQ